MFNYVTMGVPPFSRILILAAGLCVFFLVAGNAAGAEQAAVSARHVIAVGYADIEGGGMVDVKGPIAAVGHMAPPYATTLLDVSDPKSPRILSRIKTRPGTHSHKARICGHTLITNVETYGGGRRGGLALFDISDPARPREAGYLEMGGRSEGGTGVHRFQADCERSLVYAGASADGFQGNITMIIDISDPARPREVSRWWAPGQQAGGGGATRTHHPLRLRDRLYVSLWYTGFAILDISDLKRPVALSRVDYHRSGGAPTHTALPVGHPIAGRNWLLVFDEEMGGGEPPAFMRIFDITDERKPVEVAAFHVERDPGGKTGGRFGAHQPHEYVGTDNLVYAAWFSGGLRIIDLADPRRPREAGHFIPRPEGGGRFAESNDVFVDERGLIYLIDRVRGLHILRYTPPAGQGK